MGLISMLEALLLKDWVASTTIDDQGSAWFNGVPGVIMGADGLGE